MNQDGVNKGRRRFLMGATGAMGAVGGVGVAWPLLSSWQPSERAKAIGAPVAVDVGSLGEGEMISVEWRGKPIFIVRRTAEMLETLRSDELRGRLSDPDSDNQNQQPEYARNDVRSREEELLVVEGFCTHLGCAPQYRPQVEPQSFDDNWLGGFFCACHGSRFDMAGRVFRGVPAPSNLAVPPHFREGDMLTIGEDGETA
ncbi:MAG: ubiquinol-cytochrome c reductase iron-sulfur subunit [Natronospirillum sp.]|uniref:ubiquinol-cytochrome c reductase iron-sulfur subunit n=1 Tax=Natronospirillum sp. TaxID=2812955 RepID=UPI0025E60C93|nr:ubiquinol-cytochrome c reductase iron-sulfur subunit [Natronospirillum sp.]MCH8550586.1 ubiquinol-cytochrome c reductase iron-sulfur subunit [Natronospirillum sp.]